MPSVAATPPRGVESEPQIDRARRSQRAGRFPVPRLQPAVLAPVAAVVVVVVEGAAVIRLIIGVLALVPLFAGPRPAGRGCDGVLVHHHDGVIARGRSRYELAPPARSS